MTLARASIRCGRDRRGLRRRDRRMAAKRADAGRTPLLAPRGTRSRSRCRGTDRLAATQDTLAGVGGARRDWLPDGTLRSESPADCRMENAGKPHEPGLQRMRRQTMCDAAVTGAGETQCSGRPDGSSSGGANSSRTVFRRPLRSRAWPDIARTPLAHSPGARRRSAARRVSVCWRIYGDKCVSC